MRNVNIADCENLFVKDEYRHIVFSEEDLLAVINGEYVLKTPSVEEDDFPNKRVTWRESLEEAFYDTEDDCVIVDIAPPPTTPSKRRFLRKQFSVDDHVSRPGSGDRGTHSAPSSPAKCSSDNRFVTSGVSSPRVLRRSRSAERSSSSGRGLVTPEPTNNRFSASGHTHVVEEGRNKVRRVRCRHTSTHQGRVNTSLMLQNIICAAHKAKSACLFHCINRDVICFPTLRLKSLNKT